MNGIRVPLQRSGLALALLAAGFSLACDNSVSSQGGLREIDLPDVIGSTWTYEVTSERKFISYVEFMNPVPDFCLDLDTTTKYGVDTIVVSVVDTVTLDSIGRLASAWDISEGLDSLGFHYRRLWLTGNAETLAEVDTLVFYANANASGAAFYFLSPLEDGQKWECIACDLLGSWDIQHYTAEHVPWLETPAGRFTRAVKIRHSLHMGDEVGGFVDYWLAPGVGIVKRSQMIRSGGHPCGEGRISMTWELIDYHLPTDDGD